MIRTNHTFYRLGIAAVATGFLWMSARPDAIAAPQPVVPAKATSPAKTTSPTKTVQPAKPSKITQKSAAVISDPVVVPGQKIGPINPSTTYQDLVKIFGEKSLADIRPPDADDTEKEFGTRVDLGPDYSLTLVWLDQTKTKLYEAIDLSPGWKMPMGLKVGMPMEEVQKQIGPFKMVGLGGPYGGVVVLSDTLLQKHYGKMILQLALTPGADKQSSQQYKGVEGERLIPSSDPNWKAMKMSVKYMVIIFPRG
jgi:hypothetical protein